MMPADHKEASDQIKDVLARLRKDADRIGILTAILYDEIKTIPNQGGRRSMTRRVIAFLGDIALRD